MPSSPVPAEYKFTSCTPAQLDIIKATLPAVGKAGTDFTKHFYTRMFKANPPLLNLFNQTNQQKPGGQPQKLLTTVAVAAQAALETGSLPGEAIEGICQKHAALDVPAAAYSVVGEHLLGTITELLTDDKDVLDAWGTLYGDIAGVFVQREKQIKADMQENSGGWVGKRAFTIAKKQAVSDNICRLTFVPIDKESSIPKFTPGQYTTVWVNLPSPTQGPHGEFTSQPRHYTLAMPTEDEQGQMLSVSVKKQGLVSTILHEADVGTEVELSAPFGNFDLRSVEKLWLTDSTTPVVFLSAGVGITPVLAMLESIYESRPTTWLHVDKNPSVHAYRDKLRTLASVKKDLLVRRVWYTEPQEDDVPPPEPNVNTAKYHYKGRMEMQQVKDLIHLDHKEAQYYMCGPPSFMEAQTEALTELGVDASRIHTEGF